MLSVQEIQQQDIPSAIHYWLSADADYLRSMGADIGKMFEREAWADILSAQLSQPYDQKSIYHIIWQIEGEVAGHCNVNKIVFGEEAYMHLHLWQSGVRRQGCGTALVRQSLPYFFHNLELKRLYCTPYARNLAPNKTLARAGFQFVRQYICTPGLFHFEQEVNLWEMTREAFMSLK